MDKKNFPSLDELLNKVRQSEPVMQEDEAINWLYAQKELPLQKHRFKPSKIIIMTSIISSLSIVALLWISGQPTVDSQRSTDDGQQTRVGQRSTVDGQPFIVEAPGVITAPLSTVDRRPLTNIDRGLLTDLDTPRTDTVRVIRIQNDIREHDGPNEDPELVQEFVFDIQIDTSDRIPCREVVNALVLDPQALKKLGIVSDRGSLLYQQDNTPEGQVKLVFQGTMLSNYSRSGSGVSSLLAPDVLPLAILNCQGKFQYPNMDIPDSTTLEAALAIRVTVSEKGDYLIFWFPRNKDILALLPEETKETIRNNDELYHQRPWSAPTNAMPLTAHLQLKKIFWEPEETIIQPGERLNALGIQVDKSGIHFKRDFSEIQLSPRMYNVEVKVPVSEKEQFEETQVKKLQPFYVTPDHFYQGLGYAQVTSLIYGTYESFTFDKFRLVAIKVAHPEAGDHLFWYPYSPALKSLLTPEEQKNIEAKLSRIDPAVRFDPKRPKYDKWEDLFVDETPVTEALNAVQPGISVLNKLGVKITDQGGIEVNNLYANNTMLVFEFSKGGTRFNDVTTVPALDSLTRNNMFAATSAMVSITDDLGMMPRMFNTEFKDYQMNELIPVLVRSGQTYTLHDKINQNWRPDIILWFKPTKEVLAILESEGAGAIWGDVRSEETPDTVRVLCRYTELCRNKPGVFNSPLLFPNPAHSFANFSWVAAEASTYSIKLFAVNGAEVKAFTNLRALEGKNQYTMDISGLPAGIYMMILTSEKGDEMHERLVIRE